MCWAQRRPMGINLQLLFKPSAQRSLPPGCPLPPPHWYATSSYPWLCHAWTVPSISPSSLWEVSPSLLWPPHPAECPAHGGSSKDKWINENLSKTIGFTLPVARIQQSVSYLHTLLDQPSGKCAIKVTGFDTKRQTKRGKPSPADLSTHSLYYETKVPSSMLWK